MYGNVIALIAAKLSASAAVAETGILPENINYVLKSSVLNIVTESIAGLADSQPAPRAQEPREFEDVVKEVKAATATVLVY